MKFKLLVISLITIVVVMFGGCSSGVVVGMSALPDGTIRRSYTIDLDYNELSQKYTDTEIETIFNISKQYIENYLNNVVEKAKECALANGYVWTPDVTQCITKCEADNKELNIVATIMYSSATFYKLFNEYVSGGSGSGEDSEQEQETQIIEGLFYDKIIFMQTTNPVADDQTIQKIYTDIESELNAQGINFEFDLSQINLAYDYAMPYTDAQVNRVRSDADEEYVVTEVNTTTGNSYNMKHFVWQYNADGDNTITLYRYSVNSVAWYITALILVVLFGAIITIVYYVKKKTTKNTQQANSEAIDNNNDNQIM